MKKHVKGFIEVAQYIHKNAPRSSSLGKIYSFSDYSPRASGWPDKAKLPIWYSHNTVESCMEVLVARERAEIGYFRDWFDDCNHRAKDSNQIPDSELAEAEVGIDTITSREIELDPATFEKLVEKLVPHKPRPDVAEFYSDAEDLWNQVE